MFFILLAKRLVKYILCKKSCQNECGTVFMRILLIYSKAQSLRNLLQESFSLRFLCLYSSIKETFDGAESNLVSCISGPGY